MKDWALLMSKTVMFWIAGICIMGILEMEYTALNLCLLVLAGMAVSTFVGIHVDMS